jgi:hypothetical protein
MFSWLLRSSRESPHPAPVSVDDLTPVTNAALTLARIPQPDAEWRAIWAFAWTFNAYEYWGSLKACASIANDQKNTTLTDLRTCLFFEQRRWRHFGDCPQDDDAQYIRDLVQQIRDRVVAKQFD